MLSRVLNALFGSFSRRRAVERGRRATFFNILSFAVRKNGKTTNAGRFRPPFVVKTRRRR